MQCTNKKLVTLEERFEAFMKNYEEMRIYN